MNAAARPQQVDMLLARMGRSTIEHGMVLVDLQGHILWMNPAAERMLARKSDEVIGQLLDRVFTRRDIEAGVPNHERTIATAAGFADNDRWHARLDGSQFWASGALESILDERGELIAFAKIFRDRTDLKEQQNLLANEVDSLKRSREQHIAVLGTLAHELRSPLSAMFNATAVLRHLCGSQLAMAAPLAMLERQMHVIRRQVDDLVDVTRMTTGKMQLNLAPVVLQELLEMVAATVLPDEQACKQRLKLLLPEQPLVVSGDSTRLQQVFANLLSNALKFTPPEGDITVVAALVDAEAIVRVQDTGIGIRQDLLPKIFELFTQAEQGPAQQGLGIGLALVRELVTLHGGSVQVRSDGPGKGAEFTVRLPLADTRA